MTKKKIAKLKPEINAVFRPAEIEQNLRTIYRELLGEINTIARDQRNVFAPHFLQTLGEFYDNVMSACEFGSFYEPERRISLLSQSIVNIHKLTTQISVLEEIKNLDSTRTLALINRVHKIEKDIHAFRAFSDKRFARKAGAHGPATIQKSE